MELGRKIMRRVQKSADGCWQWTGAVTKSGYGKLTHDGKCTVVHRWAYLHFVGAIPEGLQLDHLCKNRACVNPAHLEPVTCRVNLLRGNTFQARNAAKTHCPQGHEYTAENTYRYPDGRRRCIACRRVADMRPAPVERRRLYKQRRAA